MQNNKYGLEVNALLKILWQYNFTLKTFRKLLILILFKEALTKSCVEHLEVEHICAFDGIISLNKNDILDLSCGNKSATTIKFSNSSISHFSAFHYKEYLHLKSLYLENVGLKYVDSLNFNDLSYGITMLSFANNKIQEFPEINLWSLEILYLDFNKIVDLTPFFGTPNLMKLHVSNNRLYDVNPSTFLMLRHLQVLNLSYNQLEKIPFGLFKKNYYLENIDLSFNHIFKTDPQFYKSLPENFELKMLGNICVDLKMEVVDGDDKDLKLNLRNCTRSAIKMREIVREIQQVLESRQDL